MVYQDANSGKHKKDHKLGILFIHGIGSQPAGDTLVRWGEVLIKTIIRATKYNGSNRVIATVESAGTNIDGSGSLEAVVQLQTDNEKETWLLSESWWAKAFLPPKYMELLSWSIRALPWTVVLFIAQRYWQREKRGKIQEVFAYLLAFLQLLVVLALTPILLLLLVIIAILGLLPISQVRTTVSKLQGALVESVGDSLVFVESPIRAALIKTKALQGIQYLKQRCEHTIVIAHSQGAAVALDVLGGFMEVNPNEVQPDSVGKDELLSREQHIQKTKTPSEYLGPDTLITFGSGINQLASLKILSKGRISMKAMVTAIGALVVGIPPMLVWLFSFELQKLILAIALFLGGVVAFSLIISAMIWIIEKLSKHFRKIEKYKEIPIYIIALLFLGGIIVAYIFCERSGIPVGPVSWLFIILIPLVTSVVYFLSREVEKSFTTVRKPPGLSRWVDVYSSADPIPNGFTRTEDKGEPDESIRIWNRGSLFTDHSTYWANLDEFVLRIVRECACVAKSPWQRMLPPQVKDKDKMVAEEEELAVKAYEEATKEEKAAKATKIAAEKAYKGNRHVKLMEKNLKLKADSYRQKAARHIQIANSYRIADKIDIRSEWRVKRLCWVRLAMVGVCGFLGASLWIHFSSEIPLLFDLPNWITPAAESAIRFVSLTVMVALFGWICYGGVCFFWGLWNRSEHAIVLDRKAQNKNAEKGSNIGMWAVVGLVLSLGYFILRGGRSIVETFRSDPSDFVVMLFGIVVMFVGLAEFVFWLTYRIARKIRERGSVSSNESSK